MTPPLTLSSMTEPFSLPHHLLFPFPMSFIPSLRLFLLWCCQDNPLAVFSWNSYFSFLPVSFSFQLSVSLLYPLPLLCQLNAFVYLKCPHCILCLCVMVWLYKGVCDSQSVKPAVRDAQSWPLPHIFRPIIPSYCRWPCPLQPHIPVWLLPVTSCWGVCYFLVLMCW